MADNEYEYDDADNEVEGVVQTAGVPSAYQILPEEALKAALSPRLLRRIDNNHVGALIVQVPTAAWVMPVVGCLRRQMPEHATVIGLSEVQRFAASTNQVAILHARLLVLVSQDPETLLPKAALAAADTKVSVAPPTSAVIKRVARKVLRGRVSPDFDNLNLDGLDFDEICACLPTGGKPLVSLHRFLRANKRQAPPILPDGIPALHEVSGYGQAQIWANDLRHDIADFRSGRIGADELDRGALLVGPTGTGKSMFASVVAKACGLPMIVMSMGDLFANDGHLGPVLKELRSHFSKAKQLSPCLLFIDELDSFADRRTMDDHGRSFWTPVVNEFLVLLDSAISDRAGVICLGATNQGDRIDSAITRPGRLERHLYIGPPDPPSLARILRFYLGEDLPDVDLLSLARARPGATGAEAEEWARAARRNARRAGRPMVWQDLASHVMPRDPRSAEELKRAATHETGHAVAAVILGIDEVEHVTIERSPGSGGHTSFIRRFPDFSLRQELEGRVVGLLAGRAAEQVLLNSHSSACGGNSASDLALATNMVCMWHTALGMADDLIWRGTPDQTQVLMSMDETLRAKVSEDLKRLMQRAEDLLRGHLAVVVAVSSLLLERRSLTGDDIRSMVGGAARKEFGPLH